MDKNQEFQNYYISLVSSLLEETREIVSNFYPYYQDILKFYLEVSYPDFSERTDSKLVLSELEDLCSEFGAYYNKETGERIVKSILDVSIKPKESKRITQTEVIRNKKITKTFPNKKDNNLCTNYLEDIPEDIDYDPNVISIFRRSLPPAFKKDQYACKDIIQNYGTLKKLIPFFSGQINQQDLYGTGRYYIANEFKTSTKIYQDLQKYADALTIQFKSQMKKVLGNQFILNKLNKKEKHLLISSCPNKWILMKVECGCAKIDELLIFSNLHQYKDITKAYIYNPKGFDRYLRLLIYKANAEEKLREKSINKEIVDSLYSSETNSDLRIGDPFIDIYRHTEFGYDSNNELMRVVFPDGSSKIYSFPSKWFDRR